MRDISIPAKCHAWGVIVMPADRKLRSHAYSRLRSQFLTPGGKVWAITALTDSFWKKIFKYLNKLEPMRENNDRTFAKSRILVRKVTGDMIILVETSSV